VTSIVYIGNTIMVDYSESNECGGEKKHEVKV